MSEPTSTKKTKVNILSDIVLNPSRDSPQSVPPLAPLLNTSKVNKGVIAAQDVSTIVQTTPSTPSSSLTKIITGEKSLKRKLVDKFACKEIQKVPKLIVVNFPPGRTDEIHSSNQETVFNYMTGTYEKVVREQPAISTESPEKKDEIKCEEITIQEHTVKDEDLIPKVESKNTQEKEITQEAKPTENPTLDGKKPTVTIDLTDDDESDSQIGLKNSILIQNVMALENIMSMQNFARPEANPRTPPKNNLFIKNNSSPIKNIPPPKLILKSPSSILPRPVINKSPVTPGTIGQPLVLMVQNNSPVVASQNVATSLQGNIVLLPNNLNIPTNLVLGDKQSTNASNLTNLLFQPTQTHVKNISKSLEKQSCVIVSENLVLNNITPNLRGKTNTNISPSSNKTSLNSSKSSEPIQIQNKLLPSGRQLNITLDQLLSTNPFPKLVYSQNSKNTINSLQKLQNTSQTAVDCLQNLGKSTNSSQNVQFSSQNISSLQNNIASSQNLRKSLSSLEIFQSASQNCQTSSQNLQNSSQNLQGSSQNLQSSLQNLQKSSQNLQSSPQNLQGSSQNLQSSSQNLQSSSQNFQSSSQNLQSSSQNLQNSSQNLQSSSQNFQSSSQNIQDSLENVKNLTNDINSLENLKNSSGNIQNSGAGGTFAQHLTNAIQNFRCQSCAYKASSKRGLILHIYNAHLKDDYELNLKCKICNFETEVESVMEKHDLGHGNKFIQEKFESVCLSNNIVIKIKPSNGVISQKESHSLNTDVPVDIIDLADSDEEVIKKSLEIKIYRCFDCNFLTSTKRSLQNHCVRHVQSKFKCPTHKSFRLVCLACQYTSCLIDLKATMLECKICGYKTCRAQCFEAHVKSGCNPGVNNALFSTDSESENESSEKFKCFHCSHVAKTLNLLKYHAIRHFGSNFKCDLLHKFDDSMTCKKCVYEMILKDLKHAIIMCECGFKTLDKSTFLKHKSSKMNCKEFKEQLKGTSAKYCQEFVAEVALLQQKFQDGCHKIGSTKNVTKSSGKGKSKVSHKKIASETPNNTKKRKEKGDFRCFHCTYITTSRGLLKFHATKHYNETFQCSLHLSTSTDCKQCLYKTVLEELNKEVLLCQDCGFRTLRQSTYCRHKSAKSSCEKYRKQLEKSKRQSESESEAEGRQAKESSKIKSCTAEEEKQKSTVLRPEVLICARCNYRATTQETFEVHQKSHDENYHLTKGILNGKTLLNCFDCNEFCTEDRQKLREHAVRHYRKDLSCDKHAPTETVPDCGKCIYLSIKNEMKKKILVCKRCSFKTLETDLFEQHKSLKSPCRNARKILGDDDDYIPEKDVSSESDSGNENSGGIYNFEEHQIKRRIESMIKSNDQTEKTDNNQITDNDAPKESAYEFKCFDCNMDWIDQSALEKHVLEHMHSTFKCDHSNFNDHCKKCVYQYILEKTLQEKILSCKCCGYKCNELTVMRSHIESNDYCRNLSLISDNPKTNICRCYDCGMVFKSRIDLWKHASVHTSDFQCSEHKYIKNDCGKCLYAFIRRNIQPDFFKCYDCPNRLHYQSEFDLKTHIEVKHSVSKFKCDLHEKELVDKCPKCLYAYMVKQTNKVVSYLCIDCGTPSLLYPSWRTLKVHINYCHPYSYTKCLDHTVKKPFLECHKCLFEKLLVYIRSQGKNDFYKCYECPLKMPTIEKLEVHVRIMHEDSKFQCSEHSLGDIDYNCGMCVYENIVALMSS